MDASWDGVLGHCDLGLDLLKSVFSEYGHDGYQIKGNEIYDNRQTKTGRLVMHIP